MIRRVRALCSGDRLAIVAPASPFDREIFERGVEEVRSLGFEPTFEESVFARTGYVAGSAAERAAALMTAWQDPTLRAYSRCVADTGVRRCFHSLTATWS